ncbi:hypothetical protein HMPREF1624_08418 [Sporothrix schenckii ATCC 58251]|uniref:Uncharacterized protein n=1 Tax=Sporothrix schenckii (strain ATCC 58251 / de Perez 2211183) TaxID=1391915 RepID=U7PI42_SPOS1|nr:hypothetical protein HMPREF1624_08418 [Sporothrix schenckii ATCC 58251]
MTGHTPTWTSTFDYAHTYGVLNAFERFQRLADTTSFVTHVAADSVKHRGWVYDHHVAETYAAIAFAVTTAVHAVLDDLKPDWNAYPGGHIVFTERPLVRTEMYQGTTEMALLEAHAAHYYATSTATSATAHWSLRRRLGAVILLALLSKTWLGCLLWPLVSWLAEQHPLPNPPGSPSGNSRCPMPPSGTVIEVTEATQCATTAVNAAIEAARPGCTKKVTRMNLAKHKQVNKSPFRSSGYASETTSKGTVVAPTPTPTPAPVRSRGRTRATDVIFHFDVDDVRRLQLAAQVAAAAGTAALAVAAAVRNTYPGLSRKAASAAAAARDAAGRATALRKALVAEFAAVAQCRLTRLSYKPAHWAHMLELSGDPDCIKERDRGYTLEYSSSWMLMRQYQLYEDELLKLIKEGALSIVDESTAAEDEDRSRNYESEGDSVDTLGQDELL